MEKRKRRREGCLTKILRPLASPFYLLIGVGLIDVDVMPLASKRILLFISTQRTLLCVLCVEINKFPYLSPLT
ncbi:hypothetical protein DPT81_21230 [Salmonella enterica subsp. enterica serovar Southampton]|nr:hypothetical protein [Salmonella enterica subsp. enterica serovar Southampton]